MGSDGRSYSYLFKGMEDLHLDERMMQFLDIVNIIFRNNAHKQTVARRLRCRNYHVTPLGQRSGLIQWVTGARPVYDLYKQWQKRTYKLARSMYDLQQQQQSSGLEPPSPPQTPIAQFFTHLTPILRREGVPESGLSRRSQWPLESLKTAHLELVKATPSNLIAT